MRCTEVDVPFSVLIGVTGGQAGLRIALTFTTNSRSDYVLRLTYTPYLFFCMFDFKIHAKKGEKTQVQFENSCKKRAKMDFQFRKNFHTKKDKNETL